MLEETLRRYQNRAIEAAQVIEELIGLAKDMREANAASGWDSPKTSWPSTTPWRRTTASWAMTRCGTSPASWSTRYVAT